MSRFWFILLVLITLMSCKKDNPDGFGMGPQKEFHDVKKGLISIKLEETGVIEPVREIDIKTTIGGKVLKLFVRENDTVKKGDAIAEIEPSYEELQKINNIKLELRRSEINLNDANTKFDESENLFKANMLSRKDLDDARDALELAKLNLQLTREQYEATRDVKINGNTTIVYASASGNVIQRPVEEGETVRSEIGSYSEGSVLVKLADLSQLNVNCSINEVDIAKIKADQPVTIQVDAFPYKTYNGTVNQIAAMATEKNNVKVFDVKIMITDPDTNLRPGMTANITIQGEKRENIVVIPIRAIFSDESGKDIVYTVKNDSIAGSAPVKTGINDMLNVEIIEGLKEGDKISLNQPNPQDKPERRRRRMRF